jgi:ferredoxin
MALVNRLLDKVGGGINRSAGGSGELEAEVGRLRSDQRLLEAALKRALHEIDRLRTEVSDLRAGVLVAPPTPKAAPDVKIEAKPAPKPVKEEPKKPVANGHAEKTEKTEGFLNGARQIATPIADPPPVALDVQNDDDNESIRAKAAGLRLTIDRNECIGCGTCVEHEDGVFHLNDGEGKAYVLRQEGLFDGIQDAIDACPVTCISWKPPHLATD